MFTSASAALREFVVRERGVDARQATHLYAHHDQGGIEHLFLFPQPPGSPVTITPDYIDIPTTPPFGVPVAAGPDAGVDGAASMLAADPDTRMAGELQAIDVEHTTEGFVVGAPLR